MLCESHTLKGAGNTCQMNYDKYVIYCGPIETALIGVKAKVLMNSFGKAWRTSPQSLILTLALDKRHDRLRRRKDDVSNESKL